MKISRHLLFLVSILSIAVAAAMFSATWARAQAPAPAPAPAAASAETSAATKTTQAAAATVASDRAQPHTPEVIENMVDAILDEFDVSTSHNTPTRYLISAGLLVVTFLLRRVVTTIFFAFFRKLASRTQTTLDDKLFVALESPVAAMVVVFGAVGALKVLKLSDAADHALGYAYTVAFSLVVFWLFLRAFNTVLDHLHDKAQAKHLGVAAFMPWIKKTLVAIVIIFGVLMIAQSLGADVKAFLAGLGIGGLAFALAAQDTIANVFGSVVVAVDQPFKVGDFVQIGAHGGTVEDIGLRSTRLRKADKSLVIIPNKTVAAEPVTNLSRFTGRRVEQTIGLTYDTKPEQLEAIVNEIRDIVLAENEVEKPSVIVQFTNLGASSLDVWIGYNVIDPDFVKHLQLKQRISLAIMRAVEARGLAFAFPTQSVQLEGELARRLVDNRQAARTEAAAPAQAPNPVPAPAGNGGPGGEPRV